MKFFNPLASTPNRRRAVGSVTCPGLPSGEMQDNIYVVGKYESIRYIANRLQTDALTLMSYNPQIPDPNRIYAGQLLNIPSTAVCAPDGPKG